jgi:hypothetical protein
MNRFDKCDECALCITAWRSNSPSSSVLILLPQFEQVTMKRAELILAVVIKKYLSEGFKVIFAPRPYRKA